MSACATCWEWSSQKILDDDPINDDKKNIEGHWSQKHTLLGFVVDTDTMMIKLPDGKVQQASSLVLIPELAPGNYGICVKTLQQLRGLRVHWLACNLFWRCLCQPIDFLLSHVSESGLIIWCGEVEAWLSFFNALTLARSLAESDEDWPLLFQRSLGRLKVMRRRLSGTVGNPFAVWTSGDAAMTRMAGINWKLKEYFQLEPEEILKDSHHGENREYQISEIELITSVGIVVFWGDLWNGRQIILLGSGNQKTFSWVDNRVAEKGLAPRIIATFRVWCVGNGTEVYSFYWGEFAQRKTRFHHLGIRT